MDTGTMMVAGVEDMTPEEIVLVLRHLRNQGLPARYMELEGTPVIIIDLSPIQDSTAESEKKTS